MSSSPTLRIGITCYPSVGGSGILATALGEELARRGHEVHFISYERPFRLPTGAPRVHFHAVEVNDYGLFKYPDYTLPLSVKMAEVSRDFELDEVRREVGVRDDEAMILHISNLRPLKRIDLLLQAAARIRPRQSFKLVILAGEDFSPFQDDVRRLGLEGRVVVRERVNEIEDFLQAADLELVTSETERFCLSSIEARCC